jgi:DNA topoisomerase-3
MKVVLAEKPSVARDIASFLGANSRREGYYEGRGYQVTWAFGHLVTLKEPAEYDPALKRWSLDTLPFVPERFELKLMDDNRGGRKQFGVIKRLFQGADELICATDAGREGELIFRYILLMTGCGKKTVSATLAQLTDRGGDSRRF